MKLGQWLWRLPVLFIAYAVLFAAGAKLLGPGADVARLSADEQRTSGLMLLAMCAVDVALVALFLRRARGFGWALALTTCGLFYFVKTFTSQIEAVYFMPNVTGPMMPKLLAMTVPLAIGFPVLAVWLLGRWRPTVAEAQLDTVHGPELWARVAVLSAVVYPVLFFGFGWFVAWRSPELRAFYGDSGETNIVAHLARMFRADPFVYPFEVLRGALWVGAAWVMIRATRGPWWHGALICGAWFALVQNDVHFLPNPLMTGVIRAHHFVETSVSNFINALCIGWVMSRPQWLRGPARPLMQSGGAR